MADLLTQNDQIDEQNRINALRQKGIQQAQTVADVSSQGAEDLASTGATALQQASDYGRRDIAAQAAESLAQARSMGAKGGISYGGLLQAGQNAGLAQAGTEAKIAGQKAGLAKDVADARQAAAAQALEATKFATQAGSATVDKAKKKADYDSQVQNITKESKGFFNDDEDLAAQKINQMVAAETDPELKAYYQDLAEKYRTKQTGYDY